MANKTVFSALGVGILRYTMFFSLRCVNTGKKREKHAPGVGCDLMYHIFLQLETQLITSDDVHPKSLVSLTQKLRFLCAKKLQRPQSGQNTAPSDLKVQVRSRPEVHKETALSGIAGIFHLGCVAFIIFFVKLIELFDHTLYYLTWKDHLPHGRGIQYSLCGSFC